MKIKCTLFVVEKLTSVAFNFGLKKLPATYSFSNLAIGYTGPPVFRLGNTRAKSKTMF